MQVAEICLARGGCIAFEWPRGCMYWHERRVQTFMRRHSLIEVRFASPATQPGPWANLSGSPGLSRPPHHSSIGSAVDARTCRTNTHRAQGATHALPKATRTNSSTNYTRHSGSGALHKVLSKSIWRRHEKSGTQHGAAIRLSAWSPSGFRVLSVALPFGLQALSVAR